MKPCTARLTHTITHLHTIFDSQADGKRYSFCVMRNSQDAQRRIRPAGRPKKVRPTDSAYRDAVGRDVSKKKIGDAVRRSKAKIAATTAATSPARPRSRPAAAVTPGPDIPRSPPTTRHAPRLPANRRPRFKSIRVFWPQSAANAARRPAPTSSSAKTHQRTPAPPPRRWVASVRVDGPCVCVWGGT